MTVKNWRDSSRAFFDLRVTQIQGGNDLAALCFVSGRDPRLWAEQQLYDDMIASILAQTVADGDSHLLEVGCASGFLALGLAPRIRRYLGVDVARRTVSAARKLDLANAEFRVAEGTRLPLTSHSMDAAICYDVFTNFPSFDIGEAIICEMLRVVRPGGRVLIGSIPDQARRLEYEKRVAEVAMELDLRYGPLPQVPQPSAPKGLDRFRRWLSPVEPKIVCYYFNRDDFLRLGEKLGIPVEIVDIHPMNPYTGFRFNAIFTKNRE